MFCVATPSKPLKTAPIKSHKQHPQSVQLLLLCSPARAQAFIEIYGNRLWGSNV